jgi:hypothetical protein
VKDLVPSLPTDNLYKFVALFGLFLFAAFTYLRIHDDFAFRKGVLPPLESTQIPHLQTPDSHVPHHPPES